MNTRSNKGFTLVEIMIVVVIIGLLAAMAIPAFQKARRASIKSTMQNDIKQLASAANQYYLEYSCTSVDVTRLVNTKTDSLMGYMKDFSKGVTSLNTPLSQAGDVSVAHPNFGTLAGLVDTGKTTAETVN